MGYTTYNFRGYRGTAEHKFTCTICGKPNRTRKFTREHTVNPFNKDENGAPKQAARVQRDAYEAARAERDEFAHEPVCASCENAMTYTNRLALRERRRAKATPSPDKHEART